MDTRHASKCGQAMIEFMVGLIAVLALIAGLLQVASLTRAHTQTFIEARAAVGAAALSDVYLTQPADDIAEIGVGSDGRSYSRDDTITYGNPALLNSTIVDRSVATPEDWNTLDAISGNAFSRLRSSPIPIAEIGLIGTHKDETVFLLPAVQNLIYAAEEIEVEGKAFMTWTRGIY